MSLPPHLAVLFAEAQRTADAGDLQQAARLYHRIVTERPVASEAWLALVRLLIAANQTALARDCCRVWRAQQPAAGGPLAEAHHELGCHLFAVDQGAEAVIALSAATEIAPDLLPAWLNLAGALLQQGRAVEALPAARRALALAPDHPECRFSLAFALADTGGGDEARPMLEALADGEPANPRYHYCLEELLLRRDEGEAALVRNARFHALRDQALQRAAEDGALPSLLALEQHAIAQGDGTLAWDSYARLAAHPQFDQRRRSESFDAARHIAAGTMLAPAGLAALAEARAACAGPAVATRAKRIVMLLLVRDEADIIRDTITFHLNQGVDFVIVTDNGSVDGTRDLLAEMERTLPVQVLDEPGRLFQQDLWTTRMAYLAADLHGAEWVFSGDADECWQPASGDFAAAIAADTAPYGAEINLLQVPVIMMVPDRSAAEAPDFRPIATRRAFIEPLGQSLAVSRWATAQPLHRQLGKVLFRADRFVALWPGNHYAVMERPHHGFARHLLIHHFHFRSLAHFRRKLATVHAVMKDNPQWQEVARDVERRLDGDRTGGLVEEYARATWPGAFYRAAAEAGRLIETDRILEAAMRPPPGRADSADEIARLRQASSRYVEAVTPLVPSFREVAVARR